ncbi:MAG: hypothetical protein WBS19_14700, partial [Candidatus Korobacteraceae bacterium]
RILVDVETILGNCSILVDPQSLKAVTYENKSGKIVEKTNVSGISYTTSGSSVCGSSGTNGTYIGNNEIEREGGGTLEWK